MTAVSGAADVLAIVLLLIGALLCLTAGLGLLRFPDVLTRMHAGTKPQVLGVLLIMVGAAIRLQGWSATWMLLLVAVFQLITAPVSAHMISRVAYRRRHVRRDLMLVDELRTGEALDVLYRGDEPADAPPEQPARALAEARREDQRHGARREDQRPGEQPPGAGSPGDQPPSAGPGSPPR